MTWGPVAAWVMKLTALTAFCALSLSTFGCAAAPHQVASSASHGAGATDATSAESTSHADSEAAAAKQTEARQAGDYVVFSFEGSFNKNPLTLTERVFAVDAAGITIDFELAEKGRKADVLRVKTATSEAKHGEVLSVEKRNEAGSFVAAKTSDYEALVARTVASADENEAVLDSADDFVSVGSSHIPVTKTRYRVKVGKNSATMFTLASDTFSWGDLGGEIRTDAGSLVYRASLVDMGRGDAPVASLGAPTNAN